MSEIYFLGTTKPLAHTRYSFRDIIPDMGGGMCGDGITFEEKLWPEAIATGVQKILKGRHLYAVQTTLGLDYEERYRQVYSEQTAADMIKILCWFRDFISSLIKKGGKVCLIKLCQGRELPSKEVKRQNIQTNAWMITGNADMIFEYGKLYEFDYIPPEVAFSRRNMEDILKEFSDCDSFSLTAIWQNEWLLSAEQAARALGMYEQKSVECCKFAYDNFSDEKRREYPSFNALWEGFKAKYSPVGREWELMPNGPEKYKKVPKPDGVPEYLVTFWAFALELGMHKAQIELFKAVGVTPPEELLTGRYAAIKRHLIQVLPSFFHHCTGGGTFRCHFVFALNGDTRAWLAQFPDTDCFTQPLEDLALYKGGDIKLSCCSHEGICNRLPCKVRY